MIRFGITIFIITGIAAMVLSLISPELVEDLILWIFGFVVAAALFKVALDILLHQMREEEDEQNAGLSGDNKAKVYYSIEAFTRARNKLKKKKRK